jgi:Tfp pilus assembly pilus retraction ATPase PilT
MVPGQSRLAELSFSDMYLEPDNSGVWFREGPDSPDRYILTGDTLLEAESMRERLQSHQTGLDFRTTWDGRRFRVQRIQTVQGDMYICRQLLDTIIPFSNEGLGYPQALVDALNHREFLRNGLILWTGGTGDGKTTAQGSWMSSRLSLFGGTAYTVENPIELLLHGRHGKGDTIGNCYQTEVHDDVEFGPAVRRLMRAAPNIIMLGEIRSTDAAAQAVLAGTSGHVVSSTLHANSVVSGLERMKNMLVEAGIGASFMADALGAIIHQKMSARRRNGVLMRAVTVQPLLVNGPNSTSIRSHLRSGDYSQLVTEIERQARLYGCTT